MLWLPYLPDLESESLRTHGSETFKGLAQAAWGKVSLGTLPTLLPYSVAWVKLI